MSGYPHPPFSFAGSCSHAKITGIHALVLKYNQEGITLDAGDFCIRSKK